jgi:hypothetical protein
MRRLLRIIKITIQELRRLHMSDRDIQKQEELQDKKIIGENQVIVNGKVMNKVGVITHLTSWVQETFVFRGAVNLPAEKPMPVNNIDEELVKLENFKKISWGDSRVLSYLITIILSIGIKIGREMEKNDQLGK